MNNDMIFDEATGEWIDPEALRAEAEELERHARWEAATLADAMAMEALTPDQPEEGDYL